MISYKFKIYQTDKNKHLQATLAEACSVWNHALAVQKRYYRLYGKFVNVAKLQRHFTKMWQRHYLGSQSLQEVLQRLDTSYKRFFNHTAKRPPKFKKRKDFQSFVFKQCGYKFFDLNKVTLTIGSNKFTFKYVKSREIEGTIKRVAIKKNNLNEFFLVVVTDANPHKYTKSHNGACIGMDFGLKHYLTLSDGKKLESPQFLKSNLRKVQQAHKKLSRCQKGSNHREQARLALCRLQEKLSNSRTDFQWKLAYELCKQYDYIFIEDLNLQGMTKLWGRKVNDLSHGSFIAILEQVASKYGCTVHKIARWFPSSKLCDCGYKNEKLSLRDRTWVCPQCGQIHDRDVLAARNIERQGIAELESNSKTIAASAARQLRYYPRISCL